jgi:hypothetical protein
MGWTFTGKGTMVRVEKKARSPAEVDTTQTQIEHENAAKTITQHTHNTRHTRAHTQETQFMTINKITCGNFYE